MSRLILFLLVLFTFTNRVTYAQAPAEKEVLQLLQIIQKQQTAWNKGDLEGFMEGYWKSDSLKFIGKNGVTYGWEATLQRYQKGYPTQEAMGKLTFKVVSIEALSPQQVLMIGQWKLDKEKATQGYFSLIWRKIEERWYIVVDHSS
ncbi:MAG: YybH family protein [Thermonemataceae bacterium]